MSKEKNEEVFCCDCKFFSVFATEESSTYGPFCKRPETKKYFKKVIKKTYLMKHTNIEILNKNAVAPEIINADNNCKWFKAKETK